MIVWFKNEMYHANLTFSVLQNYKRNEPHKVVELTSVYGSKKTKALAKELTDYSVERNLKCF